MLIASIYLPHGNPQPGPKFAYKLAWFERLITHAADLLAAEVPAVLAGDYNVVPTSTRPSPGQTTHCCSREPCGVPAAPGAGLDRRDPHAACRRADVHVLGLQAGWARDAGLRLDHLLLSPALVDRLADGEVVRDVRGQAGASDHASPWIGLR